MNAVPDRYAAQASAVQNLDRQLAGAIGIAVLGALLVSDLGAVASSDIDPDAAQAAYNRTFIVAFWVAVVGGALSIFLPSDSSKEASGSETGHTTQYHTSNLFPSVQLSNKGKN